MLRGRRSKVEHGLFLACVKRPEAFASYRFALNAPRFPTASLTNEVQSIDRNAPMELLAGRDERISATVQLPNAFGVQRTTRFTDFPRAVDTADKDQFDSHRPMFTKQNVGKRSLN